MNSDEHLKRMDEYLGTRGESSLLEYKSEFDPFSNQDWCEILKDIVAIANSGGGVVVIGLNDDGEPANYDVDKILAFDPAEVSKKIEKYTGSSYSDFRLVEAKASEARIACIVAGAAHIPLVFVKPGTYAVPGTSSQKTAFGQGTLYFRHGAKSESASPDDLRVFVERQVERVRQVWLENVRKVVEAPVGAHVIIATEDSANEVRPAKAVRLTTNKAAPEVRGIDPNFTHPYRQKELVQAITSRLGGPRITGHDVLAVRKHHDLESREDLCYKPKYSSFQYSEAFIDWVVEQYANDPNFFENAKAMFKTISRDANPDDERLLWLNDHMRRSALNISQMAKILKISQATLSRLLSGIYKGDVGRMLQRISAYREVRSG